MFLPPASQSVRLFAIGIFKLIWKKMAVLFDPMLHLSHQRRLLQPRSVTPGVDKSASVANSWQCFYLRECGVLQHLTGRKR